MALVADGALVSHPEEFEAKLRALRRSGVAKLHIVADFDRTLTRSRRADGGVNTSMSTLWLFMPEEYGRRAKELFDRYRPIEVDPSLGRTDKLRHMEDWMRAQEANCIELGFSRSVVRAIVESGLLLPRPGLVEFMRITREHDMPVLVFSAGLGDLIREYLPYHGVNTDNVHIISNFAKFDGQGRCFGWQEERVTSMTKDESHALHASWAPSVTERPNVLLLGDHLADIHMADGDHHDTILSVGFLNGAHEHLTHYAAAFDAIVPEDTGLELPISILENITSAGCAIGS